MPVPVIMSASVIAEKDQPVQLSEEGEPHYLSGSALWFVVVGCLLAMFLCVPRTPRVLR